MTVIAVQFCSSTIILLNFFVSNVSYLVDGKGFDV